MEWEWLGVSAQQGHALCQAHLIPKGLTCALSVQDMLPRGVFLGHTSAEDDAALHCKQPVLIQGSVFPVGWELPPRGILPQHLRPWVPAG